MKYEADLIKAKKNYASNGSVIETLKKKKPKKLDHHFHKLHESVFNEIDCLNCANCCKTTSPIFMMADIVRIAASLKMKQNNFIERYLSIDEDNDYVLKSNPCPFLLSDNKCSIYEFRPRACREYPHTNRKRIYQILHLTLKNTLICPAVTRIMENIVSIKI